MMNPEPAELDAKLARAIDVARKDNSRELEISGDGELDLTRLAGLPDLESLQIDCGDVSDYRPLSQLTNLRSLFLRSDQQSDLSPLATLTRLEVLDVTDGAVSDLTPLSGLLNLRELSFRWLRN